MSRAADRLLEHLGLRRDPPELEFLHRLIRAHQTRVPFETLTKLIDYEPGLARGDFLPPIELYVERILTRRAGGLCWTLARGFHFLLRDLGYEAGLLLMDPGHCCVRVDLPEGAFYADVGYAAPIFRAYPLFESFTLETHRETFTYEVREDGIFVARKPGPTKRLDPSPRSLDELRPLIERANDWAAPESFLHRLSYAVYLDGVYTSLRDGVLTRWLPEGPRKTPVPPAEAPGVLETVFGADPSLHLEAMEVQRRHRAPAPRGAAERALESR